MHAKIMKAKEKHHFKYIYPPFQMFYLSQTDVKFNLSIFKAGFLIRDLRTESRIVLA